MDKAGALIPIDSKIEIKSKSLPYVSKGGLKLEEALLRFSVNPKNYVCLDIGASTGGFTDCLLKNGARKVFAVDTGKGQLDYSLINDERVVYFENYNARYISSKDFPEDVKFDLVVIDVSFISQKLILKPLVPFLREKGKERTEVISLIKPQFEAGRRFVGKGGIVRDEGVVKQVESEIIEFAEGNGFKFISSFYYNKEVKRKNTEILSYFKFVR